MFKSSTNENDLVVDFFLGSGITAAVHTKWIVDTLVLNKWIT
ncbi:site-specific DNA-methyltransferase [Mycoplasmopsis felis]|nr:site-specific DNA-methyltransferase [Mycoplasmopsis felis]MCU9940247.1 site-specific DNA-methyltransferase [Mycoplasmopsis felis]